MIDVKIARMFPVLIGLVAGGAFGGELVGDVTALSDDLVQVTLAPGFSQMAVEGDPVRFESELGGLVLPAGSGAVLSHRDSIIDVRIVEGKPGLDAQAVVEASGGAPQKAAQSGAVTGTSQSLTLGGLNRNSPGAARVRESLIEQGLDAGSLRGTTTDALQRRRLAARSEAMRDFDSLMRSYGRRDWETMLRHIKPEWRENVQKDLRDRGEAAVIAGSNLPEFWNIACFECASESRCQVTVRINYAGKQGIDHHYRYTMTPDPGAAAEDWMLITSNRLEKADYDAAAQNCPLP